MADKENKNRRINSKELFLLSQPNYTLVPNELIDNILPILTEIELITLLTLLRAQTFPPPDYQALTLNEIYSFFAKWTKIKDDLKYSKQEIKKALNHLIQLGLLEADEIKGTSEYRYYIKIGRKEEAPEIIEKIPAEKPFEEKITTLKEEVPTDEVSYAEKEEVISQETPPLLDAILAKSDELKKAEEKPPMSKDKASADYIPKPEKKIAKDIKREIPPKVEEKLEEKEIEPKPERDLAEEIKEPEEIAKEEIAQPEKEKEGPPAVEAPSLRDIKARLTSDLEVDIEKEEETIAQKKGKAAWKAILQESSNILDTFTFNQWLKPTKYKTYRNRVHLVSVPSKKFYTWFEEEYKDTMDEIANRIDPDFKYKFISQDEED